MYLALYLAFVPQAAEPDHPIDDVILDGDLFASVGATGRRHSRPEEDRARGHILFPHHDEVGLSGFESKGDGWTSFARGGVKALWSSNTLPTDARLVFVESAIDALSHYQLHPDIRTRYASTAGTISPHQQEVITAALRVLPAATAVVLAFDRDAGGEDLAWQVRDHASRACERITSPIGKDWNDCLKVRERAFIRAMSTGAGPCLSR